MASPVSLYVEKDSGLHRLHPLTTLALAFFCLIAGVTIPGIFGGYLGFALLAMPLALWGGVGRRLLSVAWRSVLPFAISLVVVQGLFWPGGTPVLELGPLSFKSEGLAFAARSSGRILVIVSSFLLLTFTTRPDALMQALSERGIPDAITYILLTTMQIVPRFQTKASNILDAQRARGLETEGRFWQRWRGLLPLVQPLILGSIVDIEERAIALEARGFRRPGRRTYLRLLVDSRAQRLARWLLLFGAFIAVAIRLGSGRLW